MSGDLTYGHVPIPCPSCSTGATQVYHSGPCPTVQLPQVRCPVCGDLHECHIARPIEICLGGTYGFGE